MLLFSTQNFAQSVFPKTYTYIDILDTDLKYAYSYRTVNTVKFQKFRMYMIGCKKFEPVM